MKIRYQFVNGEEVEIEVPDNIGKVVISIDTEIQNSDRRETRRHNSFEELEGNGRQFYDESSNTEGDVMEREEQELLQKALKTLLPQQRELVQKVFFEGRTMTDIARDEGANLQAIQNRINKIKARLRKELEKN